MGLGLGVGVKVGVGVRVRVRVRVRARVSRGLGRHLRVVHGHPDVGIVLHRRALQGRVGKVSKYGGKVDAAPTKVVWQVVR